MSRGMIIPIPQRPCKHNLYFFYRYNGFIQASLRSKPSIHIGIIKINNTNIKVSNNERIARHSTKILIFNIKIEKILCCNSMAFQSFFCKFAVGSMPILRTVGLARRRAWHGKDNGLKEKTNENL